MSAPEPIDSMVAACGWVRPASAPPPPDIFAALDAAHAALRMVDASDTAAPQTERVLDAVSDAIALVERTASAAGHRLPEFRRRVAP